MAARRVASEMLKHFANENPETTRYISFPFKSKSNVMYSFDGIHPSAEGYRALAHAVQPAVKSLLKK